LTFTSVSVDEQAEEVLRIMASSGESTQNITRWRMSHEALSERMTYRRLGLPFYQAKSGKTDGISEWRHYLRVDHSTPHPFLEDEELKPDFYKLGCPSIFDIVADDQLIEPRDDAGLATHRRETRDWKYAPERLSVTGLMETKPFKFDENTCDATRMITAEWGPSVVGKTEDEKVDELLPPGLRAAEMLKKVGDQYDYALTMRNFKLKMIQEERKKVTSSWSTEVVAEGVEPNWGGDTEW